MTPRPRQTALAERPMRYVGRMGLQITEKRTGDMVWNSRAQKWERWS